MRLRRPPRPQRARLDGCGSCAAAAVRPALGHLLGTFISPLTNRREDEHRTILLAGRAERCPLDAR